MKYMGLRIRVFGEPMAFWANTMPEGMLLRSPRVASTIADPESAFTLEAYEAATGTQPSAPVPLSTFVSYGCWFRHHLGSVVDRTSVANVSRQKSLFKLTLKDGSSLTSHRVVVAAGVGAFRSKPPVFDRLSTDHVSHCYEGRKFRELAGKRVAVIGAGQSALESAALLHEAGTAVEVIARNPILRWIGMHPWLHHLGPVTSMLYSKHDIGPIGISRLVAYPNLLARFPLKVRDKIRKRAVRPAGSAWLPPRLADVKITTGRGIQTADLVAGCVRLTLDDGTERRVDHVLLGTGYRVDLSRYDFLPPSLLAEVRQLDGSPALGTGFSSSVPGLHFIGAAAARSYGPLLYFVTGSEFASSHLSSYLARSRAND
jgi:cation diffusion facilitator CzcD-associated flavoprotein CzcO